MDEGMQQFQQSLIELEIEAEHLLLARNQVQSKTLKQFLCKLSFPRIHLVLFLSAKKLQSYVKEKTLLISEKGVLADKISPGVLRSLVTLTDKPN
ncbi:P53 and DNA damage-regulated protein [Salix suchowensis]|nr:P53 and DNA damage-regulated protein [Salix suchowensis]